MAIWLGKQYLGQRDNVIFDPGKPKQDDPLTVSLMEEAERMNNADKQ